MRCEEGGKARTFGKIEQELRFEPKSKSKSFEKAPAFAGSLVQRF